MPQYLQVISVLPLILYLGEYSTVFRILYVKNRTVVGVASHEMFPFEGILSLLLVELDSVDAVDQEVDPLPIRQFHLIFYYVRPLFFLNFFYKVSKKRSQHLSGEGLA